MYTMDHMMYMPLFDKQELLKSTQESTHDQESIQESSQGSKINHIVTVVDPLTTSHSGDYKFYTSGRV